MTNIPIFTISQSDLENAIANKNIYIPVKKFDFTDNVTGIARCTIKNANTGNNATTAITLFNDDGDPLAGTGPRISLGIGSSTYNTPGTYGINSGAIVHFGDSHFAIVNAYAHDIIFATNPSDDGDIANNLERVRIDGVTGDLRVTGAGVLRMKETTTPGTLADYGAIYTKADNNFYVQDGAGTEHKVIITELDRCAVTKSTDQAINDSTWTSLTFNQEEKDITFDGLNNMHDNVTNNSRIVIRTTGEHIINYHIKHESSDKTAFESRVRKNGATVLEGTCDVNTGSKNTSYLTLSNHSYPIDFSVDDYVELQFWHDDGSDIDITTENTFFSVRKVY